MIVRQIMMKIFFMSPRRPLGEVDDGTGDFSKTRSADKTQWPSQIKYQSTVNLIGIAIRQSTGRPLTVAGLNFHWQTA